MRERHHAGNGDRANTGGHRAPTNATPQNNPAHGLVPLSFSNRHFPIGTFLIGPVLIGHDSSVGAGAVVVKNAPPHSVLVGIPARDVSSRSADPATRESLTDPAFYLDPAIYI